MHRNNVRTTTNNKNLKATKFNPSTNYTKMPISGADVTKSKETKTAQINKHNNNQYY